MAQYKKGAKIEEGARTTFKGIDGKTYILNLTNNPSEKVNFGDDYRVNNLFRKGTREELASTIQVMLDTGQIPTQEELQRRGIVLSDGAYKNIVKDLGTFLQENNIDLNTYYSENISSDIDPQEAAYNAYYRDVYSLEEGTTGKQMYDNLVQAERNAAASNMQLADAQLQYNAMQQAETVKQITDQVKAERMSRLRAGMSEAQIANQDMQTLMTNVNALNQQAAETNLARLQAQQQYDLAQDTAYQAYLNQANTMSQTGAAYAASDAGDINQQALRIMQRSPGISYTKAIELAQGNKS